MIKATICTIGDEILIGQIVDTNKSYISSLLNSIGVQVISHQSSADDEESILTMLTHSLKISDVIIVTGGLGPTKDDITKRILAKLSGSEHMVISEDQLNIIKNICKTRNIELSELNRDQALVPDRSTVLPNIKGTAPGMSFVFNDKLLFALPGVPYEMQSLMSMVIEKITSIKRCEKIIHKTINTFGIPESTLSTMIAEWEDSLPVGYKLAYLPNPARGVKLRLSIYEDNGDGIEKIIELFKDLAPTLGDAIYGEDEETLEYVVHRELINRSQTLAIAESCTGGRISSMFTMIPGASKYYKGSIIAYSNDIKVDQLNVDQAIIDKYGSVSEECVTAMAEGIRYKFGTNWSIATSGIAGPDGGTEEKPVGTVWMAVCGPDTIITHKTIFSGDRERNIVRSSSGAIDLLRKGLGIKLFNN